MLEIRDLRTALVGPIDLSVAAGECVTVQGASGSGKSLMLRAIVDLDPAEGNLRLDGASRQDMPAHIWRQRVALVPAESGWWAERVDEHFEPGATVTALLEAVGLSGSLHWEVERLSSGERHRLAIVRALAINPVALLLDEPTAMLDDAATGRVESLLRQRCARGMALVVVTHDADQPERLGARRLWMEKGRLVPWSEEATA